MPKILAARSGRDRRVRSGFLSGDARVRAGIALSLSAIALLVGWDAVAAPSAVAGAGRGQGRSPRVDRPTRAAPLPARPRLGDGFVSKAGEHDDPRLERGM